VSVRGACVLCALLLAMGCTRGPGKDTGYYSTNALPQDVPGWVPKRNLEQLVHDTGVMTDRIAAHNAQLASGEEREAIYRDWRELLLDARVVARPADGFMVRMWVLGELYRLGHKLGLYGAAELADDNLSACVAQFPTSVPCNGSLALLYLSVKATPARLARTEASLDVLRHAPQPAVVEIAFVETVYLRVAQRDAAGARVAIDEYLASYPQGEYASQLASFRPEVDEAVQHVAEREQEP